MSKLWTVEVNETRTLVVWAANSLEAEQVALDARDVVDSDVHAFCNELAPAGPIPDGWADSEPFADDMDELYRTFEGEEGPATLTVALILTYLEERGRAKVTRCPNTVDMFVGDSTQVTAGRQADGPKP
jgi:hypothetical protein